MSQNISVSVKESWFWARNGNGQKGWIPYSHVQVILLKIENQLSFLHAAM